MLYLVAILEICYFVATLFKSLCSFLKLDFFTFEWESFFNFLVLNYFVIFHVWVKVSVINLKAFFFCVFHARVKVSVLNLKTFISYIFRSREIDHTLHFNFFCSLILLFIYFFHVWVKVREVILSSLNFYTFHLLKFWLINSELSDLCFFYNLEKVSATVAKDWFIMNLNFNYVLYGISFPSYALQRSWLRQVAWSRDTFLSA